MAFFAACGPDWDRLDPSLGDASGASGSASGGASASSAASTGAGGAMCGSIDDGSACTTDSCVDGAPQHTPVAPGTACADNGGKVCNSAGACVQCNAPADCPGADDECMQRGCDAAGACAPTFTSINTAVSMQTPGDCQMRVCDGAGAITSIDDNNDALDDMLQCTLNTCKKGVPQVMNASTGVACTDNNGAVCDGLGACVQCTKAADCGTSTQCVTYACAGSMCSAPSYAPAGTNCVGGAQCDGKGACVSCAAPTTMLIDSPNMAIAVPNGDANGIVSTLGVAGLASSIVDVNVGVNVGSDASGDLEIVLVSPSGTEIELTSGNGGLNHNNFAGALFDDDGSVRITKAALVDNMAANPVIPERNLGLLNGQNPNGTWSLKVKDVGAAGVGSTLYAWTLLIASQPGNATLGAKTFSTMSAMATVDGGQIASPISVAGVAGDIWSATVTIDLAHASSDQLVVSLTSPGGKTISLLQGDGGATSNVFTGTMFSDAAPLLVGCSGAGCVTFSSGVVVPMAIPDGSLSALAGDTANGTWTLSVQDTVIGGGGTLNGWSLSIVPSLCAL